MKRAFLLMVFGASLLAPGALAATEEQKNARREAAPAPTAIAAHSNVETGLNLVIDASWLRSVAFSQGGGAQSGRAPAPAGGSPNVLIARSDELFKEGERLLKQPGGDQSGTEPVFASARQYANTLRAFWNENREIDQQSITSLALMNTAVRTCMLGRHGSDTPIPEGEVLLADRGANILRGVKVTVPRSEGGKSIQAMLEQLHQQADQIARQCRTDRPQPQK
jgi:hypothetical protein